MTQTSLIPGTAIGDAPVRGSYIPTKILQDKLMSSTSNAQDCFAYQQFSAKLQAMLINYVVSVDGYYSVYS